MEAITAGSSILSFIQTTASTGFAIAQIIRRFYDAPEEFQQIARQLSLLHSELHFINDLQGEAGEEDLALLPDEADDLRRALEQAQTLISSVEKACKKYKPQGKPGVPIRLRWVLQDQAKMKNTVSQLQELQSSLHTILLLINIRITNLSRNALAKASFLARTTNASLLQDVAAIRITLENVRKQGKMPKNILLYGLATRDPHDGNRFWKSMVSFEQSWLRFLGIEAVLSMYGNDYQTTYNFSGRYRLQLLGLRQICLDLHLRRFPIAGLALSLSGGFSIRNFVPEDSKIMTACKTGDIVSVKELFLARQASPNDVTPGNSSPLQYAIENGSSELVQVILASGADVNAPFGRFMTSPLEWAFASRKIEIARLFITGGAKVDHISAKGWTPVFNLFGYQRIHHTNKSCLEYLELLSSAAFSEFDIQDTDGWSAMHRAAAFGTGEDIAALLNRGSSVSLLTRLNWMPIRCAVRFGNVDTFLELVKHLPPSFIEERDVRGWTLLHEAASMGSFSMLLLTLEHGADPHATSIATSCCIPRGLENRRLTPADIARNKGYDAYNLYIEALNRAGFDITVSGKFDEDDEGDIFWPAESIGKEGKELAA